MDVGQWVDGLLRHHAVALEGEQRTGDTGGGGAALDPGVLAQAVPHVFERHLLDDVRNDRVDALLEDDQRRAVHATSPTCGRTAPAGTSLGGDYVRRIIREGVGRRWACLPFSYAMALPARRSDRGSRAIRQDTSSDMPCSGWARASDA